MQRCTMNYQDEQEQVGFTSLPSIAKYAKPEIIAQTNPKTQNTQFQTNHVNSNLLKQHTKDQNIVTLKESNYINAVFVLKSWLSQCNFVEKVDGLK